jgi:hypothetical protein
MYLMRQNWSAMAVRPVTLARGFSYTVHWLSVPMDNGTRETERGLTGITLKAALEAVVYVLWLLASICIEVLVEIDEDGVVESGGLRTGAV